VNFLSYVEITNEDNIAGFPAIFPNATSNLLLSLNDKIKIGKQSTYNSIYASCTSTVAFCPYVGMKFMTVQFSSFGLYYLSGIPAHKLHNELYDLNILFPASEIERILTRLQEIDLINQKFIELEAFVADNIMLDSIDSRVPFAMNSLKKEDMSSIDLLSRSLHITSRGLQKIFKKHVGLSPSHYRKITRFNRSVNFLLLDSDMSLTEIAYKCGYYDQAHFIKDFRNFGGISPSEFLIRKASSSDFYNYNLIDTDNLA